MNNLSPSKTKRLGLALSGGGYRAAAFHLGVLRALNKFNLLPKLDVISAISGGSIIAAYYGLNLSNFEYFDKTFTEKLQKSCIVRIVFHWRTILFILIGISICLFVLFDPMSLPKWIIHIITLLFFITPFFFQFHLISFTKAKINAYKKIFFKKKTISDLPSRPLIAINSTNLSTGTLWTFSKTKSSDSSYEYPFDGSESIKFDCSKMPVAMAVASSTSVPIPFDPVSIPKKFFVNKKDFFKVKPRLIDGGLYDNQGIHKITQVNSSYACDIIIVSDGSQPFNVKYKSSSTFNILYRGIDVMMRKIKNLQFIRDVYSGKREVAYFSLDWNYTSCVKGFITSFKKNQLPPELVNFHKLTESDKFKSDEELLDLISNNIGFFEIIKTGITDKQIEYISAIGTNLTSLSKKQIALLSKHGETLCELQLKLYSTLIN